jgi:hypothetical protein
MAFMRMMMAHARFESEVRALQGVVANDLDYGEQPENLWSAKKRPKLMVKLIEKHLGARKRERRTDLAVKQAFYRLADEKREIILVA